MWKPSRKIRFYSSLCNTDTVVSHSHTVKIKYFNLWIAWQLFSTHFWIVRLMLIALTFNYIFSKNLTILHYCTENQRFLNNDFQCFSGWNLITVFFSVQIIHDFPHNINTSLLWGLIISCHETPLKTGLLWMADFTSPISKYPVSDGIWLNLAKFRQR